MPISESLSWLALGPLVEGACQVLGGQLAGGVAGGVGALLADRFRDPSRRLARALEQAHARAWKALEVALAGETLWERCQARLARAEDRALRDRVRAFLDAVPAGPLAAEPDEFRRLCGARPAPR
jgi:hypothetical protein